MVDVVTELFNAAFGARRDAQIPGKAAESRLISIRETLANTQEPIGKNAQLLILSSSVMLTWFRQSRMLIVRESVTTPLLLNDVLLMQF